MGVLCKLTDAILFIFFLFISIVAPLIDGQTCLPQHLFPSILVDLKTSYAREYNDYLVSEKPHFFVGIVWLELIFQWPLAIASAYGIAAGKSWFNTTCLLYGVSTFTSMSKSWFNTTCLLYGVSTFTSMVAILAELTLSGRASDKLLMMYFPFLGFSLLAVLRGLLTHSRKSTIMGKRPDLNRKKRA